jgi:glycerate kinase
VGFAAIAALAATRRPGIDVVLEFTGLAGRLDGASLVITGEGSLDEQSLLGKTPMGVARAAKHAGIPVVAVCGRTTLTPEQQKESGFRQVYPLTSLESKVEICIAQAAPLLEQLGKHIGAELADLTGAATTADSTKPAESARTKEPLNV